MIKLHGESIVVDGGVTIETVPALVEAIIDHLSHGAKQIDLSGVTEVDSSAVALLLEWRRQGASRGISLKWKGVPAALNNLADLYGVQQLLPAGA